MILNRCGCKKVSTKQQTIICIVTCVVIALLIFFCSRCFSADFEIYQRTPDSVPRNIRVNGKSVGLQTQIRAFFAGTSYTEVKNVPYISLTNNTTTPFPGLVVVSWQRTGASNLINPGNDNDSINVKGTLVDDNDIIYAWVYFTFIVDATSEYYQYAIIILNGTSHKGKLDHIWTANEIQRVLAIELQVAETYIGKKAN